MNYPGSKNQSFRNIINLTPPHSTYIEAFAGGGAVLRHKRPASVANIAIDVDAISLSQLRCSIAKNGDADRYTFLNTNALQWLQTFSFKPTDFVYLDPPYLMSTRRQHRQIYRYELTDADHRLLLRIIKALPCKVMISGYWSEMYTNALVDFHTVTFQAQTRGGKPATEYLWMNYPEPTELHDYSWLGDDYRERERIKRKRLRWTRRLREMPRLERLAISAAIAELSEGEQ